MAVALVIAAAGAHPIAAAVSPALVSTSSSPDSGRSSEISGALKDIAQASSLEEARALALTPTDAALGAVDTARKIMPFSQNLRLAQARLAEARSRIAAADTQSQVADEFSGMLLATLDDDRIVHVDAGKHKCNYSTGETIAIVVGLILGIIPGLILLVVLC